MPRSPAAPALLLLLLARPARGGGAFPSQPDYLRVADPVAAFPTTFGAGPGPGELTLSNGLVSRTFLQLGDGFATTSLTLEAGDGTHFTRGVAPEARLFLDGRARAFDVGGLLGQQQYLLLYPDETTLAPNPLAFRFLNWSTSAVVTTYDFSPRWGVPASAWPPRGVHLAVEFEPPADPGPDGFVQVDMTAVGCGATCLTGWPTCDNSTVPGQCTFPRATAAALCAAWPDCAALNCNNGREDCQARASIDNMQYGNVTSLVRGGVGYPDLRVTVHTEMYDGIPALSRWLTVAMKPGSKAAGPVVSQASMELLHIPWNLRNRLHAETAFMPSLGIRNSGEAAGYVPVDGSTPPNFTSPMRSLWAYDDQLMGPWGEDSAMEYWYDMGVNETMLDIKFPFGPGVNITGSPLETFRVYEILHEDDDLDRQGLARRKLLRTVAPQVGMDITPFFSVGGDSASIRAGADAAAEAGFGAIHTQVDSSNMSAAYIAQVRSDVEYVHSKGLAAAFYVLLQNPPGLTAKDEAIDPDTGEGDGVACFATDFHQTFRANVEAFVRATGFDFVDTDGPYEAMSCASTTHQHAGLVDSQYAQWHANVEWYRSLPSMPNPYSLVGSGVMISCPDPYELAAGTWNQPIGFTDSLYLSPNPNPEPPANSPQLLTRHQSRPARPM